MCFYRYSVHLEIDRYGQLSRMFGRLDQLAFCTDILWRVKRLLPIVLLACLMAPLVATFTVHEYRKEQVRREVKWRLIRAGDRGDLTLVRGTLQELAGRLRWVHDREFELNGQMFDVVEKVVSGDSCYYYCWHDHAETSLNRQMKQLLARALASDPVNRGRDSKVRDFFKSLYFEAKHDLS